MRTIGEMNLLLRVPAELAPGIRLATDEIREDWCFARSTEARRIRRIRMMHDPLFLLSRAGVTLYCMQPGASRSLPLNSVARPIGTRWGRLPRQSTALLPQFASALAPFKQRLSVARTETEMIRTTRGMAR
jgi:hypothetical protein